MPLSSMRPLPWTDGGEKEGKGSQAKVRVKDEDTRQAKAEAKDEAKVKDTAPPTVTTVDETSRTTRPRLTRQNTTQPTIRLHLP